MNKPLQKSLKILLAQKWVDELSPFGELPTQDATFFPISRYDTYHHNHPSVKRVLIPVETFRELQEHFLVTEREPQQDASDGSPLWYQLTPKGADYCRTHLKEIITHARINMPILEEIK